ncbi:MAG: beta-ketoacyl-ACP reductase [Alphaproteobacteria bacterium 33-17]|nr:MAG: beta-ketoacyl-ACP reductase [Alphaproteobacteria bacterium 33-17]
MSRIAVVTGGTRGIGKEIARTLKNAGYTVIATYNSDDASAEKFKQETDIGIMKWDVSNFDECNKKVNEIIATYGNHPEILVNNAGITRDGMLHKSKYEDWDSVMKTNLYSCYNMCHAVITKMRENNFGRIVNISSINALSGQLGQTNYSAAKAGMIGFTKALAKEGAVKNITVNAIAPGYIATEMLATIKEEVLTNIKSQIPMGRLGTPEEVARAVEFLVSDNAGFITGSTISINGGQYMA